MNFSEYGNPSGKPVVYFHGVPGSPIEASVFESSARALGLRVLCFDRFSIDPSVSGALYYQRIAQAIDEAVRGAPVDFIGFSIGSHVALEVCRQMPGRVKSLHLVSAVAPLDEGDFLNEMAGKGVFSLARNRPVLFSGLAKSQAFLASLLPGVLARLLFASAAGQDKALASQPAFRTLMKDVLQSCFTQGASGYMRDINQFLAPWWAGIFECEASVHLWHGTHDNWSPVAMADYLARAFPGGVTMERLQGGSHYSCLFDAAAKICLQLSSA